jgi:hypothetical protein
MLFPSVPVYCASGLRPAIALILVEIKRGDGSFAENALECNAAVYRFGCVTSHNSL